MQQNTGDGKKRQTEIQDGPQGKILNHSMKTRFRWFLVSFVQLTLIKRANQTFQVFLFTPLEEEF